MIPVPVTASTSPHCTVLASLCVASSPTSCENYMKTRPKYPVHHFCGFGAFEWVSERMNEWLSQSILRIWPLVDSSLETHSFSNFSLSSRLVSDWLLAPNNFSGCWFYIWVSAYFIPNQSVLFISLLYFFSAYIGHPYKTNIHIGCLWKSY